MNKYTEEIAKTFKDAPALKVDKIYNGGDRYLFSIKNTMEKSENLLDPWYTIDKKSTKIKGFLPHTNIKWFNNTLQNEVKAFL